LSKEVLGDLITQVQALDMDTVRAELAEQVGLGTEQG
jgi:hypothetical protein